MIYSTYSAYSTCFLICFRRFLRTASNFVVIHGACACSKVRVHSECFTGDVLGSKRCDCGPQLRGDRSYGAMGRRVTCGIRSAIRKLRIRCLKALRRSRYVKMWRIVEVRLSGAIARGNLNFDMDLAFQY